MSKSYGKYFSDLWQISILSSTVIVLVCIPNKSALENVFSWVLPDSHSNWGKLKLHCSSYLHFFRWLVIMSIFHVSVDYWYFILWKCSANDLCPFLFLKVINFTIQSHRFWGSLPNPLPPQNSHLLFKNCCKLIILLFKCILIL